jgi:hypothetical protein
MWRIASAAAAKKCVLLLNFGFLAPTNRNQQALKWIL